MAFKHLSKQLDLARYPILHSHAIFHLPIADVGTLHMERRTLTII